MINPLKPRACLVPSPGESQVEAFFRFLNDADSIRASLQELQAAREEAAPIIARADEIAALEASFAARERRLEERESAVAAREATAEAQWAELRRIAAAEI
jgi:hypothetical protein